MTTAPLCIYHHACLDGIAAAWVVRDFYIDLHIEVEFHPGIYGEAPPDVTGRDVILVDFSYKREILLPMIEQARSMLILDHHKTAEEDLANLPKKARTVFDMNRSGAMIAWDHYFPGKQAPALFDFIQDRDLWQFKYPLTREVTAACYSYPLDFDTFMNLTYRGIHELFCEGHAILRKHQADVTALIAATRRRLSIGGHDVPVANVPYMYASDVGHELAQGEPFSATYYDDADGRRFSLRSTPEGLDVSAIAKRLGGGGHRNAAGFRLSRSAAIAMEAAGGVSA